MRIPLALSVVLGIMCPMLALSQELRLVSGSPTAIDDPEAYRAYYGKLDGQPDVYTISSDEPFRLSLRVLTPLLGDAHTDFSAVIYDMGQNELEVIALDGTISEWTPFFDSSGRDDYLAGPPLRGGLAPGNYEIRVSNPGNMGAYVLIVGEEGGFFPAGIVSRYSVLPTVKTDFFGKPRYEAYMTPLLLRPAIAGASILAALVFGAYILQRRRSSFTEVTA